jgi:hypothetical protein
MLFRENKKQLRPEPFMECTELDPLATKNLRAQPRFHFQQPLGVLVQCLVLCTTFANHGFASDGSSTHSSAGFAPLVFLPLLLVLIVNLWVS